MFSTNSRICGLIFIFTLLALLYVYTSDTPIFYYENVGNVYHPPSSSDQVCVSKLQFAEHERDMEYSILGTAGQWSTSSRWWRSMHLDRKFRTEQSYTFRLLNLTQRQYEYPQPSICSKYQSDMYFREFLRQYNLSYPNLAVVTPKSESQPRPWKTKYPIIDITLFNDEWQLLILKIEELKRAVDLFIIVECHVSFTNATKPLHFTERFIKIYPLLQQYVSEGLLLVHVCNVSNVDDPFPFVTLDSDGHVDTTSRAEWPRENWMRRELDRAFEIGKRRLLSTVAMSEGVNTMTAMPDISVTNPLIGIVGDTDQITRYEAVAALGNLGPEDLQRLPKYIHMRAVFYQYRMGCMDAASYDPIETMRPHVNGAVVHVLTDPKEPLNAVYANGWKRSMGLQKQYSSYCQGWHCSNCMDHSQFINKMTSFSHAKQVGRAYTDPIWFMDIMSTCFFRAYRLERSWENLPAKEFLMKDKSSTYFSSFAKLLPI